FSVWEFDFRSEEADYSHLFIFTGFAYSLGSMISQGTGENWTGLKCDKPFSACDLNWNRGRINAQRAGLWFGWGSIRIWANDCFTKQKCEGVSVLAGASLLDIDGLWKKF